MIKKTLKLSLIGASALGFVASTMAADMKFLRLGTGGAGGTYYPIGGIIANGISNPPGSRACDKGGSCGVPGLVAIAQSTNASVHNVNAIQAGDMEAGLAGSFTAHQAYHGKGKFKGDAKTNLRVLALLYTEDMQIYSTKANSLSSLKDLKGKRLSAGPSGSGTRPAVLNLLKDVGLEAGKDFEVKDVSFGQGVDYVLDGNLDWGFLAAGTPTSNMVRIDSSKGLNLYSMNAEEVKLATKSLPFYIPSVIPAGTYAGLQRDTQTVGTPATFLISAKLSTDLVYQITKAMWNKNTRRLLDNGHAKGKAITVETALDGFEGLKIPLHPGAEKYYKEIGLIK